MKKMKLFVGISAVLFGFTICNLGHAALTVIPAKYVITNKTGYDLAVGFDQTTYSTTIKKSDLPTTIPYKATIDNTAPAIVFAGTGFPLYYTYNVALQEQSPGTQGASFNMSTGWDGKQASGTPSFDGGGGYLGIQNLQIKGDSSDLTFSFTVIDDTPPQKSKSGQNL